IARREGDLARQLPLDADRSLHRVRCLQGRRDATIGLREADARKRCDWRRIWELVQDRSTGRSCRRHHKLLLIDPVEAISSKRQRFTESIIENAKAAANNCGRLACCYRMTWRPGKRNAGCKSVSGVNAGLCVV